MLKNILLCVASLFAITNFSYAYEEEKIEKAFCVEEEKWVSHEDESKQEASPLYACQNEEEKDNNHLPYLYKKVKPPVFS